MGKPVEFDPAARAEFDEGFNWYAERSLGAAIGFASEVDEAVEKIAAAPDRFARTYAGCQSCALNRYPYRVVYRQTEDKVVVLAIAHAKRRPGYWHGRA